MLPTTGSAFPFLKTESDDMESNFPVTLIGT